MSIKYKSLFLIVSILCLFSKTVLSESDILSAIVLAQYKQENGFLCGEDKIYCNNFSFDFITLKYNNYFYLCNNKYKCIDLNLYFKNTYTTDTIYTCSNNTYCSSLFYDYKINKDNNDTFYMCLSNSIGKCGILNSKYKINTNKNLTYICDSSMVGKCNFLNHKYKFNSR